MAFSTIGRNGESIDTYCFPRFQSRTDGFRGKEGMVNVDTFFPGAMLILIEDLISISDMKYLLDKILA
jgi:hypothetical protein